LNTKQAQNPEPVLHVKHIKQKNRLPVSFGQSMFRQLFRRWNHCRILEAVWIQPLFATPFNLVSMRICYYKVYYRLEGIG